MRIQVMVTALKLTIDQLEALPDDNNRYELIDGELLSVQSLESAALWSRLLTITFSGAACNTQGTIGHLFAAFAATWSYVSPLIVTRGGVALVGAPRTIDQKTRADPAPAILDQT
jgi:hypothetical protein